MTKSRKCHGSGRVLILALRNGFQLVPESVQWQVVKHGRWHNVPRCGPIKSRTLLTSCCLHFCRLEMWTTLDTVANASSCRYTSSNATRVHFYSRTAVLKITHCYTASQWQLWRTDKTRCDCGGKPNNQTSCSILHIIWKLYTSDWCQHKINWLTGRDRSTAAKPSVSYL